MGGEPGGEAPGLGHTVQGGSEGLAPRFKPQRPRGGRVACPQFRPQRPGGLPPGLGHSVRGGSGGP